MLGSVREAEDVVQEGFLRMRKAEIANSLSLAFLILLERQEFYGQSRGGHLPEVGSTVTIPGGESSNPITVIQRRPASQTGPLFAARPSRPVESFSCGGRRSHSGPDQPYTSVMATHFLGHSPARACDLAIGCRRRWCSVQSTSGKAFRVGVRRRMRCYAGGPRFPS